MKLDIAKETAASAKEDATKSVRTLQINFLLNVSKEKSSEQKEDSNKSMKQFQVNTFEQNIEKDAAASNKEDSTKDLNFFQYIYIYMKLFRGPASKTRTYVETLRIELFLRRGAHILSSSCLASKYYNNCNF